MRHISRIATKPDTQAMIKALRQSGFTVDKLDGGYECKSTGGVMLFKAMVGTNSYLVRMVDNLFL